MKLEIELDLNKIDYDAINKQIAEKVAELNIKEEYDIESKINNKITSIVNKDVDDSYNSYIRPISFHEILPHHHNLLLQSLQYLLMWFFYLYLV